MPVGTKTVRPKGETMPTKIEPREHPILFSGPMVRAILDDRKTQTRRVIVPQPAKAKYPIDLVELGVPANNQARNQVLSLPHKAFDDKGREIRCPYGKPGDWLWVRETFCYAYDENDQLQDPYKYWYRASNPEVVHVEDMDRSPWKPSIHMPKSACRIWLEVTRREVARVQDISYEDARAEGVKTIGMDITIDPPIGDCGGIEEILDPVKEYQNLWDTLNAVKEYQNLWDTLNAKRGYGWDQNPWVWVVEFGRVDHV